MTIQSQRRSSLRRLPVAAVVAAFTLGASSCSLLWLFQSDPEGLPCELDANGLGACLDGYACVSRGDDQLPVCLKAAALREGEPCEVSAECMDGLTCASAYADCKGGSDDPNCSLVDNAEKELRCRTICLLGDPSKCGPDARCFQGEPDDFCQRGVCASDSDCQARNDPATCVDEGRNPGRSGVCFEACDPLSCRQGTCPDCTGLDGIPDANRNCIPAIDVPALTQVTMCDAAGTTPVLAPCDPLGEPCEAGAFCNDFLPTFAPYCAQWCLYPTGAPACDGDARCEPAFDTVGVCVPN